MPPRRPARPVGSGLTAGVCCAPANGHIAGGVGDDECTQAPKNRPVALPATSRRSRRADPIPTVAEAKRRLALAAAAGLNGPWLNMSDENQAAMEEMEKIAGGCFVGPADWRAADTE